jgi:hypothetical protein
MAQTWPKLGTRMSLTFGPSWDLMAPQAHGRFCACGRFSDSSEGGQNRLMFSQASIRPGLSHLHVCTSEGSWADPLRQVLVKLQENCIDVLVMRRVT